MVCEALPTRIPEHVCKEQFGVVAVRLEQQRIGFWKSRSIACHADLHARVNQGAEGLAEDHGQARIGEIDVRPIFDARGVEGHQRIDADDQVAVRFQRERSVHRADQGAVDVVLAANLHGRVQPRQRGACGHRARYRDARMLIIAEHYRRAGIQIGRNDEQPSPQPAKVVAAAVGAKYRVQIALKRIGVE